MQQSLEEPNTQRSASQSCFLSGNFMEQETPPQQISIQQSAHFDSALLWERRRSFPLASSDTHNSWVEKRWGQFAWVVVAHCSRCQTCVCCDHKLLILSSRKRCTSISWAGRAMPPLVELGQTSPIQGHRRCSVSHGKLNVQDRVSRWCGSPARGAQPSRAGRQHWQQCLRSQAQPGVQKGQDGMA